LSQCFEFTCLPHQELIRGTGKSLLTTTGSEWKRQRSLLNPAFHHMRLKGGVISMRCTPEVLETDTDPFFVSSIPGMIGVFNQQVLALFRILDTATANDSHPTDMKQLFSRLSMNVIGMSAFNCEVPRCIVQQLKNMFL
jgi:hypothetical protein